MSRISGLLAAALAAASFAAGAQPKADAGADYPARPVHILVGFTPGGGPDITARYLAQKLGETWKQQVIVDNRPGAGGTLAAHAVARAAPDGYTLLSVSSAHAVAAAIYPKLPYDTQKDLAGVTQTAASSYVLTVAPALGVGSVAELIARAKANPGQLNFSSAGVGSGTHFAGEMFKAMAGIDVVHVPFKGIPEALTETVTGRVQFFMAPIANAVNLVREGKLKGLAVSSAKRDALLPDLPTVAEAGAGSGLSGYESILWFGLLVPAGAPRALLAKLNRDATRVLEAPETRQRWAPIGLDPRPTSPEDFDRLIRDDIAVFSRIAKSASINAE